MFKGIIEKIKHLKAVIKTKRIMKKYWKSKDDYQIQKELKKQKRIAKREEKTAAKNEKQSQPKLSEMNRSGRRSYMRLWRASQIIHRWKPKQKYKRAPKVLTRGEKFLEQISKPKPKGGFKT